MPFAITARARRSWDEEVTASSVELDGERLRGSSDGEWPLPELATVVVGKGDHTSTLRSRAANEGSIV